MNWNYSKPPTSGYYLACFRYSLEKMRQTSILFWDDINNRWRVERGGRFIGEAIGTVYAWCPVPDPAPLPPEMTLPLAEKV